MKHNVWISILESFTLLARTSLCLLCACTSPEISRSEKTLHLREIYSRSLDANFRVAFAATIDEQTIALISRNGACQLVSRESVDSCGQFSEPVIGVQGGSSGIDYLTTNTVRRRLLNGDDEEVFPLEGVQGTSLDQAVMVGSSWIVGGVRDLDSAYVVAIAQKSGYVRLVATLLLDSTSSNSVMMRRPLLSADGEAVYASYQLPPFSRKKIEIGSARILDVVQPFKAPVVDTAEFVPEWRARHTYVLQSGLLQVFADIRSDARALSILPQDGSQARQSVFAAPIGILAVEPRRRRIVALRSLVVDELVWYGY